MNPIRLDLNDTLIVQAAADLLTVPIEKLQALLDRHLFRPLLAGPDGTPLVAATALYPFLQMHPADRLPALERLASLTQRLSEPPRPKAPGPNAALLKQMDEQSLVSRRALVEKGKVVDAQTLAGLLGTTEQLILEAEREGRVLTLPIDGRHYYPRLYADKTLDWRAVEVIVRLIVPVWTAFHLLHARRLSLSGATPLEALREGQLELVVRTAMAEMEL
jgi:hypothetical protein